VEISGARVLIVGATGALGEALCAALTAAGAQLALAGRSAQKLDQLAGGHRGGYGPLPARQFEAYDVDACAQLPAWAEEQLGRLDAVLVTIGVAAFGPCEQISDVVAEHLVAVNTLAPIATLRAALPLLTDGGAVAGITGVVSVHPQPGMADYSAAKSALAAWLTAVRAEQRNKPLQVLDARLPHLDTGFAQHAVYGEPLPMPAATASTDAAAAIVHALTQGAGVLRARSGGQWLTSTA
jgi:short-subunit dehydrogenase